MVSKTKKLVFSAMLAAIVCVVTMVVKVPYHQGYLNLGDGVVLLCGALLSPLYGFLAAAVGSGLADLFFGYVMYAPVTFVIKGCMALIVCFGAKRGKRLGFLLGGLAAEALMVLGYFAFETVLYGAAAAAVNAPMNAIQGAFGLALGLVLIKAFEKNKLSIK